MKNIFRIISLLGFTIVMASGFGYSSLADDKDDLLKEAREKQILFTPSSINNAIENYYEVLEKDPDNVDAHAGLAQSYSLLGHYNKLVKNDYENDFNVAHSYIEKALKLDKNDTDVKRALGYYYLHLSREKETAGVAKDLLKKDSKDYEAMYLSWAADGKNPDDERIHKVLKNKPELIPAHVDLAESYFYRKRSYTRAAEQVSKAIDVQDSCYLRDLLGTMYRNQHAYDKSIDEFKKALRMDSGFAPAVMNYGISLYYKNKVNDSIDQLTKAISMNPRFPEAYFFLAKNYERKGEKAKSSKYYTEFIRMVAGDSKYYGMVTAAKQSLGR